MNVLEMTNIEFFELGIATLLEKLGPTGVSRFLRQCEPGIGDYTIERHKWLDKIDREAGLKEIKKIQNARAAGQSNRKFASLAKAVLAGERELSPKKVQKLTDTELCELAVEILTEKLTPGGLIGFFLQCNPVTGDCSVNRHTWLDKLENGGFQDIHAYGKTQRLKGKSG
jgi:hypothetical protein